MRGTSADSFTADRTLFETVDLTGTTLGSETARSTITNSVFDGVSANRATPRDGDKVDGPGQRWVTDDVSTEFLNLDFVSVSFHEVSLRKAVISQSTFQGCGLDRVDLAGASIIGSATNPGEQFDPTFADSILEDVRFDGARLRTSRSATRTSAPGQASTAPSSRTSTSRARRAFSTSTGRTSRSPATSTGSGRSRTCSTSAARRNSSARSPTPTARARSSTRTRASTSTR